MAAPAPIYRTPGPIREIDLAANMHCDGGHGAHQGGPAA